MSAPERSIHPSLPRRHDPLPRLGRAAPPLVFVHGLPHRLDAVAQGRAAARGRAPLHRARLAAGIARERDGPRRRPHATRARGIVADFIDALELEDVTLVGNDTGGAICQLVATRHPERLGRLVLTPCDAYENFLPPMFRPLQAIARVPGLDLGDRPVAAPDAAAARPQRVRLARQARARPRGHPGLARALAAKPRGPARHRQGAARDLEPLHARGRRAAREFDRPALIAWAPEDHFFKFKYGRAARGRDPGRAAGAHRGLLDLRLRGPARAQRRADRRLRPRDVGQSRRAAAP